MTQVRHVSRQRDLWRRIKKYRMLLLMLIPGIIYYIVFHYMPMYGITLAFKDFKIRKGIMASPWVGFQYFEKMFASKKFWGVVENTLIISLMKLFFGFFPPIILAIALNETPGKRFRSVVQTVSYLPHFISWVVMAGIIIDMTSLNGPINAITRALGGEPVMWMAKKDTFRGLLVISDIWKGFGWGSIIYFDFPLYIFAQYIPRWVLGPYKYVFHLNIFICPFVSTSIKTKLCGR